METSLKLLFTVLITSTIISCSSTPKINDIIPPQKVIAGEPDSIVVSDLFYSDNYSINLKQNNFINASYDKDKKIIHLKTDSNFKGITLLEFEADMNVYEIPIISKKLNTFEFSFKPETKYTKINLFGSFNGWDRTNIEMHDADGDGIFTSKVPLEPGNYQYKFFGDGEEIEDPINPNKVSNGMGSYNSLLTIAETEYHKLFLHIDKFQKENNGTKFSFYVEDSKNSTFTKNNIIALIDNSKIEDELINIDQNKVEINLKNNSLKEENSLRVILSIDGIVSNIQTVKLFNGIPVNNENFNWNDGIIYSLLIDRFNDGNKRNDNPVKNDSLSPKANYMGGDFEGIISKLNNGYFDSLGINVLWISPVNDNPNDAFKEYPAPHRYYSGYHGYWPISDNRVEEHFGNMAQLKEIIAIAHKKGIKVLLDFVSNHVHIEHPFYKEHRDWFGKLELPDGRLNLRFWDEFRLTTWFEPYLPSFDYLGSPEALEKMTDNAVWWLIETGADGYRHDAVKHVPNEFWRKLNSKIKAKVESKRNLPVYQIGETFGSYDLISSYVNNGQLNSQFNFNLYDVALPTFIKESASFSNLDKEMQKTFSVYGYNHVMGNIMDSHDKNRFMAYADGDLDVSEWSAIEQGWNNPPQVDNPENYKKLILYMAYMNSIPGLPVIYYGSEFGMTGASDPDNRRMMRFNEQLSKDEKNTLSEVRKIINLRKNHSALRQGDFYTLQADENIYCYLRSDFNERILVVINKSKIDQEINLKLPEEIHLTNLNDLMNQNNIQILNRKIAFTIPASDWKMFLLN